MLETSRETFVTARYALYYAPEPDSALGRFGTAWFARQDLRPFTSAARRYGFHATLKAPFRLARGEQARSLLHALERFCATRSAFRLPPLTVAVLDRFLALVPTRPEPRLDAIATACVKQFECFRAPLNLRELEHRRAAGLNAREQFLLRRWGYPHVLERFRFHLSLTGPSAQAAALRESAVELFARHGDSPPLLDSVCVFREPAAGADLQMIHRERLAFRGRLIYVVGPSGAGKDSLLDWVRAQLIPRGGVRLARRAITRPALDGGEAHEAVSESEFERRRKQGEFALHWRANGHGYGIGREILQWLDAGDTVVVNGSREYLRAARARFPQLENVHVLASAETLRTRLSQRGRERPAEATARLARNGTLAGAVGAAALVLNNDGPLEVAGARLAAFVGSGDRLG